MLTRLTLALTIACSFSAVQLTIAQEQPQNATPPKDMQLFLLAGQSNMAGRGKVTKQDKVARPRVWMLTKDLKWVPAVDPLHFDKPAMVGVGLGRSFADVIAEHDSEAVIGLIPCAVGGSPIDSWKPGGFHPQTRSHPWDDAIQRTEAALDHGTLQGILWHQGESDSNPDRSNSYQAKLDDLIARFRKEFDEPELPFVAGQMGQFPERPWDDHRRTVDRAHQQLPSRIPHTAFADSHGLTHKGDRVHFDAMSYRKLGRRYAKAFLAIKDGRQAGNESSYEVQLDVARKGFDGTKCWVHARAGAIPPEATGRDDGQPTVIMTMQELLLSGSDVFYALNEMRTEDFGRSWKGPYRHESFARKQKSDSIQYTVCDFTPGWHARSKTLLGTGQTVWYENNHVMHVRPRATAYATYAPSKQKWSDWKELEMPAESRFENAGAGSVQRFDLESGEVLLPIYFKEPKATQYSTTVVRCSFDGSTLKYVSHGNELTIPIKRGLYEPSLTRYEGRYFLTLRNDDDGYVSTSEDGANFSQPLKWRFDDGQILGNYNTQQHWVTHDTGLYLVYTRRGAENDHVFRHRAPLFMAQVDPETLRVIRSTERIIVPENGARQGNFAVVKVSPAETWITVTEWMQPKGIEKYGSDNRIYVARIQWKQKP